MLTRKQCIIKRIFDLTISLVLFLLLIIPLLLLTGIATMSTKQRGLFTQQRIGRYGNRFSIYKIRSLKGSEHLDILVIKKSETGFGRWIRETNLDELPQLINVILGNMSLVGPRPDVPGYADSLQGEDRIILSVKPGITGPATIKYRNEDKLLMQQVNPKKYNDEVIWPDKVAINKKYIKNWSLQKDIGYLFASLFGMSSDPDSYRK
ncbi:MAG: sugar transferase [Bacteroidetes bacterium]|nr:sugar transferase [Bacteroidota bacterium]